MFGTALGCRIASKNPGLLPSPLFSPPAPPFLEGSAPDLNCSLLPPSPPSAFFVALLLHSGNPTFGSFFSLTAQAPPFTFLSLAWTPLPPHVEFRCYWLTRPGPPSFSVFPFLPPPDKQFHWLRSFSETLSHSPDNPFSFV